jgi:hypothetical protein
MATNGLPVRFTGVATGSYSLCVVEVFADLRDPAAVRLIQRDAAKLPVACVGRQVDASRGAEQAVTVDLP